MDGRTDGQTGGLADWQKGGLDGQTDTVYMNAVAPTNTSKTFSIRSILSRLKSSSSKAATTVTLTSPNVSGAILTNVDWPSPGGI